MCNCIQQINTQLEPQNAMLDVPLIVNITTGKSRTARPGLFAVRIDPKRRTRVPAVIADFCPFCGERYLDP